MLSSRVSVSSVPDKSTCVCVCVCVCVFVLGTLGLRIHFGNQKVKGLGFRVWGLGFRVQGSVVVVIGSFRV